MSAGDKLERIRFVLEAEVFGCMALPGGQEHGTTLSHLRPVQLHTVQGMWVLQCLIAPPHALAGSVTSELGIRPRLKSTIETIARVDSIIGE